MYKANFLYIKIVYIINVCIFNRIHHKVCTLNRYILMYKHINVYTKNLYTNNVHKPQHIH